MDRLPLVNHADFPARGLWSLTQTIVAHKKKGLPLFFGAKLWFALWC
jgi:hypothetical protein